uniref:Uncharacterized protein n=1 Tax=Triticum urartu TaxID=4572 RepID=A0A8R7R8N2_TRIUA
MLLLEQLRGLRSSTATRPTSSTAISRRQMFSLIRATAQSCLILGWRGMGQTMMRAMSLQGSWAQMDMQPLNIWIQFWCGAPGDPIRPASPEQEPSVQRAQPGGVGAAVPEEQATHLPHPGRAAGRAVLPWRRAEGCCTRAPVHLHPPESPAGHGAGGGGAGAARGRQGDCDEWSGEGKWRRHMRLLQDV